MPGRGTQERGGLWCFHLRRGAVSTHVTLDVCLHLFLGTHLVPGEPGRPRLNMGGRSNSCSKTPKITLYGNTLHQASEMLLD